MFHQNDFMTKKLGKLRSDQLLAEARRARMRSQVEGGKRFYAPLLLGFAEGLIRTGKKLQERYSPLTASAILYTQAVSSQSSVECC